MIEKTIDAVLGEAFAQIEDVINDLARQGGPESAEALDGIALHCQQLENHIDGLHLPGKDNWSRCRCR